MIMSLSLWSVLPRPVVASLAGVSYYDDGIGPTEGGTRSLTDTIYRNVAKWGSDLGKGNYGRTDMAVIMTASAIMMIAIHNGSRSIWPWSLLATVVFLMTTFDNQLFYRNGKPEEIKRTSEAVHNIYDHALRNTVGFSPNDDAVMSPHLYSIDKLHGKQRWLKGDPYLISSLNTLRPFSKHDGHRVRLILELLGEFYRRYDRVLNFPRNVHVKNEYTILHDLHLKILNTVHELYFTKAAVLCANLEVVIRTIQSRTYRMLRVLRNKYPTDLKAVGIERGTAPRSYDTSWTSYDFFV